MLMMIKKKAILEAFRGSTSKKITKATEFLAEIEKRFVKLGVLLTSLISMRHIGKDNIKEYVIEMSHLAFKLRAHKLELSKDLLMYLVLISLPTKFNQFKVSYNN